MQIPNRYQLLFFLALLPFGSGYSYDFAGSIGAGPGETLQTKFNEAHFSSTSNNSSNYFTHATNQALYFCYSGPNVALSIAAGTIIDSRVGLQRASIIFSLIGTLGTVMFLLGAHFTNLPLLLLSRTVLGFGNEGVVVAMGTFISRHWKAGKLPGMALAFGFSQSMQRVAGALNFAISPRLAESYGLLYALLGGVVANIVSFFGILIVLALERKWANEEAKQNPLPSNNDDADLNKQQEQQSLLLPPSSCSQKCKNIFSGLTIKFWVLMLCCCMIYDVVFPFVGTAKILFQSVLDLSSIDSSQAMSVYQIFLAVGQPLTGIIVDKIGRLSLVLLFSSIVSLIGVIFGLNLQHTFPSTSSSTTSQIAGSIILCLIFAVSFVCAAATTRASVPLVIASPKFTGRAFGIMAALIAGSTSIMRIVSGVVLDSSSSQTNNNNYNETSTSATLLPSPAAFEFLFYIFLGIGIFGIVAAILLNLVDGGYLPFCISGDEKKSVGVLLESVENRKKRQQQAKVSDEKKASNLNSNNDTNEDGYGTLKPRNGVISGIDIKPSKIVSHNQKSQYSAVVSVENCFGVVGVDEDENENEEDLRMKNSEEQVNLLANKN